jgi:hypothetical protein
MKMKYLISISILLNFFTITLYSQTILKPNFALKSHETLEITKIEMSAEKAVIYFSLENRKEGGSFCADKNIFLIYPNGNRMKLIKANGIPVCPQNYNFKNIGEKLDFNLVFPPLKPATEWIDIIEECSANCLWFYGLTLNNDLNRRLDEAFASAAKGKPEDNMLLFRNLLESLGGEDHGIEGSLYVNIINAAIEAGNKTEAAAWYRKLLSSHAPRLDQYVKYLNDKGIRY